MGKIKEALGWKILRDILLACGLVLILFPLYLVLINSFKTLDEAGKRISLPFPPDSISEISRSYLPTAITGYS